MNQNNEEEGFTVGLSIQFIMEIIFWMLVIATVVMLIFEGLSFETLFVFVFTVITGMFADRGAKLLGIKPTLKPDKED